MNLYYSDIDQLREQTLTIQDLAKELKAESTDNDLDQTLQERRELAYLRCKQNGYIRMARENRSLKQEIGALLFCRDENEILRSLADRPHAQAESMEDVDDGRSTDDRGGDAHLLANSALGQHPAFTADEETRRDDDLEEEMLFGQGSQAQRHSDENNNRDRSPTASIYPSHGVPTPPKSQTPQRPATAPETIPLTETQPRRSNATRGSSMMQFQEHHDHPAPLTSENNEPRGLKLFADMPPIAFALGPGDTDGQFEEWKITNLPVSLRRVETAMQEQVKKWKEEKPVRATSFDERDRSSCQDFYVAGKGKCPWTKADGQRYSCRTCTNKQRLCMLYRDGRLWVLPVHPDGRITKQGPAAPTDPAYWMAAQKNLVHSTLKSLY